jgi:hypothetical protein
LEQKKEVKDDCLVGLMFLQICPNRMIQISSHQREAKSETLWVGQETESGD